MRCLNGEIFARLVVNTPEHEARCRAMGITDSSGSTPRRTSPRATTLIFAATGVTDGDADEGRALLRRRHAHQLARHAEQPGAHPLHRHHPRRAGASAAAHALLRRADASSCRCAGGAISSRSPRRRFIGFTGFTLVMPFLPLYFQQLGVTTSARSRCGPGLSLGVTPAITALLAPFWGRARRSLRPQDHGRAVAGQLRRRHGGDGVRDRGRGTCSRCARCRDCSPATARWR